MNSEEINESVDNEIKEKIEIVKLLIQHAMKEVMNQKCVKNAR